MTGFRNAHFRCSVTGDAGSSEGSIGPVEVGVLEALAGADRAEALAGNADDEVLCFVVEGDVMGMEDVEGLFVEVHFFG